MAKAQPVRRMLEKAPENWDSNPYFVGEDGDAHLDEFEQYRKDFLRFQKDTLGLGGKERADAWKKMEYEIYQRDGGYRFLESMAKGYGVPQAETIAKLLRKEYSFKDANVPGTLRPVKAAHTGASSSSSSSSSAVSARDKIRTAQADIVRDRQRVDDKHWEVASALVQKLLDDSSDTGVPAIEEARATLAKSRTAVSGSRETVPKASVTAFYALADLVK
jgi:hypothetical protein